eukprot:m.919648 g.919648  ORF g.919648 m.919648 type:complete len:5113 (+) comp60190_c0_seq1:147-15485(+)
MTALWLLFWATVLTVWRPVASAEFVVRNASISPSSINTETSPQILAISLDFAFAADFKQCMFVLMNGETFSVFRSITLDASAHLVAGNASYGTLLVTTSIPQYTVRATYTTSSLSCTVTQSISVYSATNATAGLNFMLPTFSQTGRGDAFAPNITAFSVDATTINTTVQAIPVVATIVFTDDFSGVSSCSATLIAPPGNVSQSSVVFNFDARMNLIAGSTANGTMRVTSYFPRYSRTGTWLLNSISCNDASGKSISSSAILGSSIKIQQLGTGDDHPPQVVGVSFSPSVLDLAAASSILITSIRFTDDSAGLKGCSVSFFPPNSTSAIYSASADTTSGVFQGSLSAGTLDVIYYFPRTAASGVWKVQVWCDDRLGQGRTWSAGELGNASFAVNGTASLPDIRVLAVSFAPASMDTSQQNGVISVNFTTNAPSSPMTNCWVYFSPPPNSNDNQIVVAASLLTVNVTEARSYLIGSATVPRYSRQGVWMVTHFSCQSFDGTSKGFGSSTFPGVLTPTSYGFTQSGPGDIFPPSLVQVAILTTQVNTTLSTASVELAIDVTDDMAGVYYCAAQFADPATGQIGLSLSLYASGSLVQGSSTNGTLKGSQALARYSSTGFWSLQQVTCVDILAHQATYSNLNVTDGSGSKIASGFTQVGTAADSQPPAVVAVSISPASINTSAAAVSVTVSVRISDDFSGVTSCFLDFSNPVAGGNSRRLTLNADSLANGTLSNGTLAGQMVFAAYGPKGDWILVTVQCVDAVNRRVTKQGIELAQVVLADSSKISQLGSGDAWPPVVSSITVVTESVNASVAAASFQIEIGFADDLSGVASCSAYVDSENAPITRATATGATANKLLSGSTTNGTVLLSGSIPAFSATGFWALSYVACVDAVGRTTSLAKSQCQQILTTVTAGIMQAGVADLLPPVVQNVRFSPTSVSTGGGTVEVRLLVDVSDDVSGLASCSAVVVPPSGSQARTIYPRVLVSTSTVQLNGTLSLSLTLPQYAEKGNWSLSQLTCYDRAGRGTPYLVTSAVQFVQTAQADLLPPSILAFLMVTKTVNTSEASAAVQVMLRVSDDLSGVQSCQAVFYDSQRADRLTLAWSGLAVSATNVTLVGTLGRYAAAGVWRLDNLQCVDAVGRAQAFSESDLRVALPLGNADVVFTQGGTSDRLPPVLEAFSVSSASVNSTLLAASLLVTFTVSDDFSGIFDCTAYWSPPTGKTANNLAVSARLYNLVSGTPTLAVLQAPLTVPRFSKAGNWQLFQVVCSDAAGRSRTWLDAALTAIVPSDSRKITVVGPGDELPPSITGLTLWPTTFDTSRAGGLLQIQIAFFDDFAGLGSCSVWFRDPSGSTSTSASTSLPRDLTSGSVLDGTVNITLNLALGTAKGLWLLMQVTCSDASGAQTSLTSLNDFRQALGVSATPGFNQTGSADATPPAIIALTFNPPAIDTSLSGVNVNVFLNVSDDLAGVTSCMVQLRLNSSNSYATTTLSTLLNGTRTSGFLSNTLWFPRFSQFGFWNLSQVSCNDAVGRSTIFTQDVDLLLLSPTPGSGVLGVNQTSSPCDLAPNNITSVAMTPSSVDTSLASRSLTLLLGVTDDCSGVSYCRVDLVDPGTFVTRNYYGYTGNGAITSGTSTNGQFSLTFTLPAFSSKGFWKVLAVECYDFASKSSFRDADTLRTLASLPRGSLLGFDQTGRADNLPPTIVSFDFSDRSLDTTTASRSLRVSLSFLDDISGVQSCSVSFVRPSTSNTGNLAQTFDLNSNSATVSGTRLNGSLIADFPVPRFSDRGFYPLAFVSCIDLASNTRTLYPDELKQLGLAEPIGFTQVGVPDLLPPSITSLVVRTLTVDTSRSSALIQVDLAFQDDVSGVASCNVQFDFPSRTNSFSMGYTVTDTSLSSGTRRDGSITLSQTLGQYAPMGLYQLISVTCWDTYGLSISLYGTDQLSTRLRLPVGYGFNQTGKGDATPPEILRLRFFNASIDTSQAAQVFVFQITFQDDFTGVSQCGFDFLPPTTFANSAHISGTFPHVNATLLFNTTLGAYRGNISVPRYSAQGSWTVNYVYCQDVSGKSRQYSGSDLLTLFVDNETGFNQTGLGDSQPINVTYFGAETPVVDTSQQSATVRFTIGFKDDLSGMSRCTSWFSPRGTGTNAFSIYFDGSGGIRNGSALNGFLTSQASLSSFSTSGRWDLTQLHCADISGTFKYYNIPELLTAWNKTQDAVGFLQAGLPDTQPPTILQLSLTPSMIDTSAVGVSVNLDIQFSDDSSGVEKCSVQFDPPSNGSSLDTGISGTFYVGSYLRSGTSRGGVARFFVNFNRFISPGFWNLSSLQCNDLFGRIVSFSGGEFSALGLNASIGVQQVGKADVLPPVLQTFSFSPAVVNTSLSAVPVQASFFATDDSSGIRSCAAEFRTPAGSTFSISATFAFHYVTGDQLAAQMATSQNLALGSAPGNYTLNRVYCYDVANRYREYNASILMSLFGFTNESLTFQQVGRADQDPPAVVSVSVSPTTVHALRQSPVITVTIQVSDDFFGASSCGLTWSSSQGSGSYSLSVSANDLVLIGANNTKTFRKSLLIPQFSPNGTSPLSSVTCYDTSNRPVSYSTLAAIQAANFCVGVCDITQGDIGDRTAPVLSDVSLSPQQIDTSQAAATLEVTLVVSDDLSGLSSCNVYFGLASSTSTLTSASFGGFASLLEGSLTNGTFRTKVSIPRFAAAGQWNLQQVYCCDFTSRCSQVSTNSLIALVGGSQKLMFTQTGLSDTSGPTIKALELTAHQRLDGSLDNVTYQISATDDLSGVATCVVAFSAGNAGLADTVKFAQAAAGISNANVSASRLMDFPSYPVCNAWNLTSVRCVDFAGRATEVTAPFVFSAFNITTLRGQTQPILCDTTPPVIKNVTLSPATVQTNAGPAVITMFVSFTDDISGLASCSAVLVNPSAPGLRSRTTMSTTLSTLDANPNLNGTRLNGTVALSVELTKGFPSGRLLLQSVSCLDVAGRAATIDSSTLGAPFVLARIFVNQTDVPDTTVPNITSVAFWPLKFDTTSSGVNVQFVIAFESAMLDITTCSITFQETSRLLSFSSSSSQVVNGTRLKGSIGGFVAFPQFARPGTYMVYALSCATVSRFVTRSYSTSFGNISLSASGVVNSGAEDLLPPFILDVALTPPSVNVSSSTQRVDLQVFVRDDVSGVRSCFLSFAGLLDVWRQYVQSISLTAPADLLFSNSTLTVLAGSITIPQGSATDKWSLYNIQCSDFASRTRSGVYFPGATFQVVSGQQSISSLGSIVNLTFAPHGTVNTEFAPALLSLNLTFEGQTPLASCLIYVSGPDTSYDEETGDIVYFEVKMTPARNLLVGDLLSGILQAELELPRFSPKGLYTVNYAYCQDIRGRSFSLYIPPAAGVIVTLEQIGAEDLAPPAVLQFEISPRTFSFSELSRTQGDAQVSWTFSDDVSGISSCFAEWSPPANSSGTSKLRVDAIPFVSGILSAGNRTIGQLTASLNWRLMNFTVGTWTITSLGCTDRSIRAYSNSLSYPRTAILSRFPSSSMDLVVLGQLDVSPPRIVGFKFSPSLFPETESNVMLSASFTVSDDLSGVSSCMSSWFIVSADGVSLREVVTSTTSTTASAVSARPTVPNEVVTLLSNTSVLVGNINGSLQLQYVSCSDSAGNRLTSSAAELAVKLGVSTASFVIPRIRSWTTPPSVLGLSVVNSSSNGIDSLNIRWNVSTGSTGISQCTASFRLVGGYTADTFEIAAQNAAATSSSTPSNVSSTYILQTQIPKPVALGPGTWEVFKVACSDIGQNTQTLISTPSAPIFAVVPSFAVSSGDAHPPAILGFAVSPTLVSPSALSSELRGEFTVSDDFFGVANCSAVFSSSSSSLVIRAVNGTGAAGVPGLSGVLRGYQHLAAYAGMAPLVLQYVLCTDFAGRTTNASAEALLVTRAMAAPVIIRLNETAVDVAAPVIIACGFAQSVVNASAAGGVFGFWLDFQDDTFSMQGCTVTLQPQQQLRTGEVLTLVLSADKDLTSGNLRQGRLATAGGRFLSSSSRGRWAVTALSCQDRSGHTSTLAGLALGLLPNSTLALTYGSTVQFSTLPTPAITGLRFNATTVDTSAGAAAVQVTLNVTDALSASQCVCTIDLLDYDRLDSSARLTASFVEPLPSASTKPVNASLVATLQFAQFSTFAFYELLSVTCINAAGGRAQLTPFDSALARTATGQPIRVSQVGLVDQTAPVIAGFTLRTAQLDTSQQAREVLATIRAVDAASGVAACSATFALLSVNTASTVQLRLQTNSSQPLSGTVQNGTWLLVGSLPRLSSTGTWSLQELACTDRWQHTTVLGVADFSSLELAGGLTVRQTGVGDAAPVSITACTVAPAAINTTRASADVVLSCRFTDDRSGLDSCTFTVARLGSSVGNAAGSSQAISTTASAAQGLASGTTLDGTLSAVITVPKGSPRATWSLSAVVCQDQAGLVTRLDASSTALRGATVEQQGYPNVSEVPPATPPTSAASSSSTPIIAAAVVIVLVLILVAVLIAVLVIKKRKAASSRNPSSVTRAMFESESSQAFTEGNVHLQELRRQSAIPNEPSSKDASPILISNLSVEPVRDSPRPIRIQDSFRSKLASATEAEHRYEVLDSVVHHGVDDSTSHVYNKLGVREHSGGSEQGGRMVVGSDPEDESDADGYLAVESEPSIMQTRTLDRPLAPSATLVPGSARSPRNLTLATSSYTPTLAPLDTDDYDTIVTTKALAAIAAIQISKSNAQPRQYEISEPPTPKATTAVEYGVLTQPDSSDPQDYAVIAESESTNTLDYGVLTQPNSTSPLDYGVLTQPDSNLSAASSEPDVRTDIETLQQADYADLTYGHRVAAEYAAVQSQSGSSALYDTPTSALDHEVVVRRDTRGDYSSYADANDTQPLLSGLLGNRPLLLPYEGASAVSSRSSTVTNLAEISRAARFSRPVAMNTYEEPCVASENIYALVDDDDLEPTPLSAPPSPAPRHSLAPRYELAAPLPSSDQAYSEGGLPGDDPSGPALYQTPFHPHSSWFRPAMTRSEANVFLSGRDASVGSFVVRCSSVGSEQFVLSVRDERKLRHLQILPTETGLLTVNFFEAFGSLQELIEYYLLHPLTRISSEAGEQQTIQLLLPHASE